MLPLQMAFEKISFSGRQFVEMKNQKCQSTDG